MTLLIHCEYVNTNEFKLRARMLETLWDVQHSTNEDLQEIDYVIPYEDVKNIHMGMHYLTVEFKDPIKEDIFFRLRDMTVDMQIIGEEQIEDEPNKEE